MTLHVCLISRFRRPESSQGSTCPTLSSTRKDWRLRGPHGQRGHRGYIHFDLQECQGAQKDRDPPFRYEPLSLVRPRAWKRTCLESRFARVDSTRLRPDGNVVDADFSTRETAKCETQPTVLLLVIASFSSSCFFLSCNSPDALRELFVFDYRESETDLCRAVEVWNLVLCWVWPGLFRGESFWNCITGYTNLRIFIPAE